MRKFFILILIFLLTSWAFSVEPYPSHKIPPEFFAVQAHFGHFKAEPGLNLPLIQKMGATHFRDELFWHNIEAEKSLYSFPSLYDNYITAGTAISLGPIIILNYANENYDGGLAPYTEEGRAAFAEYCRRIVGRYKDKVKIWEIWNEPNIDTFWKPEPNPEHYAALLKEAYNAVKSTDPEAVVLGCSTSGIDLKFIEEVFKNGAAEYMDAISVHPYTYPTPPELSDTREKLAALTELCRKYNGPKEIWITEVGYPTHTGPTGVTLWEQAALVTRTYLWLAALPNVRSVCWYDFQNDGGDPEYNEDNFGLVMESLYRKPAYHAYQRTAQNLTGRGFIKEERLSEGTYLQHYIDGDDKLFAVLWGTDYETVRIKTKKPVFVSSIKNQRLFLRPNKETVLITATPWPRFIFPDAEAEYSLLPEKLLSAKKPVDLYAGVNYPLDLVLNNRLDYTIQTKFEYLYAGQGKKLKRHIDSAFPDYTSLFTTSLSFSDEKTLAMPGERVGLKAALTSTAPLGSRDLEILLSWGQRDWALLALPVHTGPGLVMGIRPAGSFERPELIVEWDSRFGSTEAGVLEVTRQQGRQTIKLNLKGRGSYRCPAKNINGPLEAVKVEAVMTIGDAIYDEIEHLNWLPVFRQDNITIDAGFDDWNERGRIPVLFESPALLVKNIKIEEFRDLNADYYGGWSEAGLMFGLNVYDDIHVNTFSGVEIWKGDSIQLAVAQSGAADKPAVYEFGLALTDSGPEIFRWLGNGAFKPDEFNYKIKRTEGITAYEILIPWTQIPEIGKTADDAIRFTMLVNEADADEREGCLGLFRGIAETKNIHKMGFGILMR